MLHRRDSYRGALSSAPGERKAWQKRVQTFASIPVWQSKRDPLRPDFLGSAGIRPRRGFCPFRRPGCAPGAHPLISIPRSRVPPRPTQAPKRLKTAPAEAPFIPRPGNVLTEMSIHTEIRGILRRGLYQGALSSVAARTGPSCRAPIGRKRQISVYLPDWRGSAGLVLGGAPEGVP